MHAIQVVDLHKAFGDIKAVQGVSFEVAQGEIFSLLGPNGAGKTTTISMLSTLLRPDRGDAHIMGHSLRNDSFGVRAVLGVVPQEIALYEDLTARENLVFWGKMYGLRGAALKARVAEVLETIGLADRAKGYVKDFSGGMKRRVNIGVALLHKPQVIYMDEPTVGIDPQSRRNILDSVVALKNQGMTVLYTTHYMEEAQELSNRIAIMDHGRLIACGTHEELVRKVGQMACLTLAVSVSLPVVGAASLPVVGAASLPVVGAASLPVVGAASLPLIEDERLLAAWRAVPGIGQISSAGGVFTILAEDSNLVLPRLFDAAALLEARITSVNIQEPDLEAVFLYLTGRALRD